MKFLPPFVSLFLYNYIHTYIHTPLPTLLYFTLLYSIANPNPPPLLTKLAKLANLQYNLLSPLTHIIYPPKQPTTLQNLKSLLSRYCSIRIPPNFDALVGFVCDPFLFLLSPFVLCIYF